MTFTPYDMEFSRCPLGCLEGDNFVLSGEDILNNMPGTFQVVKCKACGLQRTNPRPSASSMNIFYPDSYPCFNLNRNSVYLIKEFARKVFGYSSVKLPSKTKGRLLEIGCSTGSFLKLMADLGWCVEGIEFSPYAAKLAIRDGLNVKCSSIEASELKSETYDLVVGWMVLEHLHDPILSLNKLYDSLKIEGHLVISVPDAGSFCRKLFKGNCYDVQLPTHLYHFDFKTIRLVLEKVGFEVVKTKWQRNPDTVLRSLEFYFKDKPSLSLFFIKLRTTLLAQPIRIFLGFFLGVMRQSGRMEVWAKKVPGVKKGPQNF